MRVDSIGFYRELPHGDSLGPSIREVLGKGDIDIRDQVARYVESGTILGATSQRVCDVLKGEKVDAGPLATQTDGRWVWPADLAYYVREYNVELPSEFVEWARSADWVAPELSTEELYRVEAHIFPEEPSEGVTQP